MTISALVACIIFSLMIACVGGFLTFIVDSGSSKILCILITILIITLIFFGTNWYFTNTASGQRAVIDEKSELRGGIERVINVYTANGDLIAHYEGKIDIEANDGGYIKFDFEGKRYIYYNCFVESIAEINK